MTTDNRMTNQFTDEQIGAGAKALFDRDNPGREHALLAYEEVRGEYEAEARAALEAAAGVAPQAPEGRELDALRALIENRARVIEGFSGAPAEVAAEQKAIARSIRRDLEDHDFDFRVAPVQPSSTVDEDALAEVIGRHKLVHVSVSRKSAFCTCSPKVTAGVEDNRAWFEGHRARAVAEWLKEQVR